VQDGYKTYQFTAENGQTLNYEDFASCIYARTAQHILVRDNVVTNCGQAFYDWIGDGSSDTWWAALSIDITLRTNYFYNNGVDGSYSEHQTYTEAQGVIIEGNRYGAARTGSLGSQLKDRSVGTVIRYNYFEQSVSGWLLDLVEPEESWPTLGTSPLFKQAFVYGNTFHITEQDADIIHWNEDHQVGHGRAIPADGRLFFYHNSVSISASGTFTFMNEQFGGFDCPPDAQNGRMQLVNNLIALPTGSGLHFGYCSRERVDLDVNWVSPGWTNDKTAELTGTAKLVSPTANNPGFVDLAHGDFRLAAAASPLGIGAALPAEVTNNSLGGDFTPTMQYVLPHTTPTPTLAPRSMSGAGSDAGAFQR
jgi:hypothetical protein